ncbi:MAG: CDP-diacylglycerol--glycerol-3-phosphate 3-phosphatidyltransferase [Oligoflexia bacterium]|nr:CDP-diacylglycerol--glycerol-3-phosphate 3-phosphatidyltransferase [Oligoflexia bacterium]
MTSISSQSLPFWKRQLPNIITGLRAFFVLPVVALLMTDSYWPNFWATGLFIVASVSDYFDGYFARIYKIESIFGKFLDPVADKLLVNGALIMLIPLGRVHPILVFLILSRDIFINGLRAVAASENLVIGAGWTGKWKTGTQMTAIPCIMLKEPLFGVVPILEIGQVLLWVSFGLSAISGVQYALYFFKKSRYMR